MLVMVQWITFRVLVRMVVCRLSLLMFARMALRLRAYGGAATRRGKYPQVQPGDDAESQEPNEQRLFQMAQDALTRGVIKQKSQKLKLEQKDAEKPGSQLTSHRLTSPEYS